MWFMKAFAVIIPLWILVSIVSGEISMMTQLDKSGFNISYSEDPLRFIITICLFIGLEYYLVKTIVSTKDDGDKG